MSLNINAETIREYSEEHGMSLRTAKAAMWIENEYEKVDAATDIAELKSAIKFLLQTQRNLLS